MRIGSRQVFVFSVLTWSLLIAARAEPTDNDIGHIREELGVNDFTAPSIQDVLNELRDLQPIPFEKAWRDLPQAVPRSRAQLALCSGQVIADGFLAVAAQKQSRIEPVGRLLLKLARGLGVGEHVTRRSRSILELAARRRWPEVERELVRAQAEVEAGMMALKDEEIAHLVSLGGWLRGLEITSSIVLEEYTPDRAERLVQPALLEYFADRVSTLNPHLLNTPTIQTISENMRTLRQLATRSPEVPITLAEVKQIRNLARTMNRAITAPEQ